MPSPKSVVCEECIRIARELNAAARADADAMRTRLENTAASAGQEPEPFARAWLASIKRMPDDELRTLSKSFHPRLIQVRRRSDEHVRATGHFGWYFGSAAPLF
jgi:hypothetical protein